MKMLGLLVALLGTTIQLIPSDNALYLEQFYRNHTTAHDIVIHNQVIAHGSEQFYFDAFYQIAHYIAANYKRPILLVDVMPEYGYCPFKLIQDVDATAVLLVQDDEYDSCTRSNILHRLSIEQRVDDKLIILNNQLEQSALFYLSGCEHFDIVLVSNLFKACGAQWKTLYPGLLALGERVIVGIATDGVEQSEYHEACKLLDAHNGTLITTITKDNYEARFYVLFQKKISVKTCALNDSKPHPNHAIESSYYRKLFIKDGIERPWYGGINIMTFRALHGVVPSEDEVLDQLEALAAFTPKGANTIIAGKKLLVLP